MEDRPLDDEMKSEDSLAWNIAAVDGPSRLRARLALAHGVSEAISRFGREVRLAWRAGAREIAHLHAADVIDVRVPATLQRQWRNDPRMMPRRRRSDWIECRFKSHSDIEFVAMLVEIAARHAGSRQRKG
jgi:luciferase-like monooxygenase